MSTITAARPPSLAFIRSAFAASTAALLAACGSNPESIQLINQTQATLTVTTRQAPDGPGAAPITPEPILVGPGAIQSWVISRQASLAGPRLDIIARSPNETDGKRYTVAFTPPGPYAVTARGGPELITFEVNRPTGTAGDRQEQRTRREILNPVRDGPR